MSKNFLKYVFYISILLSTSSLLACRDNVEPMTVGGKALPNGKIGKPYLAHLELNHNLFQYRDIQCDIKPDFSGIKCAPEYGDDFMIRFEGTPVKAGEVHIGIYGKTYGPGGKIMGENFSIHVNH